MYLNTFHPYNNAKFFELVIFWFSTFHANTASMFDKYLYLSLSLARIRVNFDCHIKFTARSEFCRSNHIKVTRTVTNSPQGTLRKINVPVVLYIGASFLNISTTTTTSSNELQMREFSDDPIASMYCIVNSVVLSVRC